MNKKYKRKTKNKSILYLLLLAILTCIAISSTFARYTTTHTGNGEAYVAKWSFKVEGLDNATLTRTTITDTIAEGRLAPGTEGYFSILIDAWETEVALDYEIEISDIKNKPENLNFYTNSTYTTQIEGVEKEVTNADGTITTQTTYTLKGHMSLPEILDENTARKTVRIYWQWPYETAGGDEQDTEDGLIGDMEFTVKVIGSQSLEEATEVTMYKITYDLNNGDGDIPSQTKQEGIDATITSEAPSRTGYTFLGWAIAKNSSEVKYRAGDTYTTDADTTLYAVWEAETYTVTYNYAHNGGTSVTVQTAKAAYDEIVDLTPIATKVDYDFVGWTRSQTDITPEEKIKMEPNDMTIYAIYSKKVTITYDCLEEQAEYTIYNNQTESRMTVTSTIPEKPNYVFKNWNTKQDGTGTSYEPSASYTSTQSTKLYAQWEDAVATTETTGYSTLALAMSDVENGQTVTMLKDSTETETATVASGKNVTLDLGGKTVSYNGINGIENAGELTVTGSGKITDTAGYTINNTGTLNVNTDNETSYNNGTGGIIETTNLYDGRAIVNTGILNMYSGIVCHSGVEIIENQYQYTIVSDGIESTMNMYGGIIRNTASNYELDYAIYNSGTFNMQGGAVESTGTTLYNSGDAIITKGSIIGGTIEGTTKCAINNRTKTLTISGSDEVNITSNCYAIYNTTGEVTINNSKAVIESTYHSIVNADVGTITVLAGTVTAENRGIDNRTSGMVNITGNKEISISGVKFAIYNRAGGILDIDNPNAVIKTSGGNTVYNLGTLEITGGTISSTYARAIWVDGEGKVTVNGEKTVIQKSGTETGPTIDVTGNASAELLGGIIQTLEGSGSNALYNNGTGTVKIDGATIQQLGTGRGGTNGGTGRIEVISGSIMGSSYGLINESTDGTIIIGTIGSQENIEINGVSGVGTKSGVITINAGKITGTNQGILIEGGKTIINDGTIGEIAKSTDGIDIRSGTLEINGGTITGINQAILVDGGEVTVNAGILEGTYDGIDNNAGTVVVNNGTITGVTQAIIIDGGEVIINAGILEGEEDGIDNNAGTLVVNGGIINGATRGINMDQETTAITTIGNNADGTVYTDNPIITGTTYGVKATAGTLNFYDGVIKGITAISGTVTGKPTGYSIKTTTATDGTQTAILSK